MKNKLSSSIKINQHFLRSTRVDSDLEREDIIEGYILQPSAKTLLDTMGRYLSQTKQRAFTWTGPYGGGKSSLVVSFAALASDQKKIRNKAKLSLNIKKDSELDLFIGNGSWLILPIVGKRESIVDQINIAIDNNLKTNDRKQNRKDVIKRLVSLAEGSEYQGVLLIIDELGKFLENTATEDAEDINFYQDLAEAASRCNGKLVVIGILHQSFEQYAFQLGPEIQKDWAKVQGRYVDIPLVTSIDETISLLGNAIQTDFIHKDSLKIVNQVTDTVLKRKPSTTPKITKLLDQCWPLHPLTAFIIGPTSRKRFGQNERSIFSFLVSPEIFGFWDVINGLELSSKSYYWPSYFWDYLSVNFDPLILSSPDGHRWSICKEAIERAESKFSSIHIELIKVIGLIELFGSGTGLFAEENLLYACIDAKKTEVKKALNDLLKASIIIYRRHLDTYGIYEGSDFDIDEAINKVRNDIDEIPLSKLNNTIDLTPITARRHYWETGSIRWFSRVVISEKELIKYTENFKSTDNKSGEFILVLANTRDKELDNKIRDLSCSLKQKGMTIGLPANSKNIISLIYEFSSLQHVLMTNTELEGDNIALRELTARLQLVKAILAEEFKNAFYTANWYYNGDIKILKNNSLQYLASDIADDIYYLTPHVQSELVNRDNVSASAAKARRDLMYAMFNFYEQEDLGYSVLSTFPADAGLYYTVIKAQGLHRKENNQIGFYAPNGEEVSNYLAPMWEDAKKLILQSSNSISLQELYELWVSPPYGVKSGLLPIFALAFFMTYRDLLALYIEGVFIPDADITEAHIDEWLQDPKRISWLPIQMDTNRKEILEDLSKALGKRLGRDIAADTLDAARALVTLVFRLPSWTRKTNSLSKQAKDVRNILLNASDPYKVLFNDLPDLLKTKESKAFVEKVVAITDELTKAFEFRLKGVEDNLFKALDHQNDLSELRERIENVSEVGTEFKLGAFITTLKQYTGKLVDIERLIMVALSKPSKDWAEHDIDIGEAQLVSWSMEFRRIESLAFIRNRPETRRALGLVFGAQKTVTSSFDISKKDEPLIQEIVDGLLNNQQYRSIKKEVFLAAIAEVGVRVIDLLEAEKKKV